MKITTVKTVEKPAVDVGSLIDRVMGSRKTAQRSDSYLLEGLLRGLYETGIIDSLAISDAISPRFFGTAEEVLFVRWTTIDGQYFEKVYKYEA